MKKYALLFIIAASAVCSLSAYGQEDRIPRLGSFHSVSIQIPAQTVIIQGKHQALDMDMSESTARKVDIFNDRGTLVIKSKGAAWLRRSDSVKIMITMPSWESLNVTASGSLRSEEFWIGENMKIRTTGSCDVFLNSIEALTADILVSGSGNISLNHVNAKKELNVSSTGSGNILVQELTASDAGIKLTGSGDMSSSLDVGYLKATLTGSGDLRISGQASQAELQTTGSGDIDGAGLKAEEATVKITGSGDVSLRDDSRIKEIRMTGSGVFRSR